MVGKTASWSGWQLSGRWCHHPSVSIGGTCHSCTHPRWGDLPSMSQMYPSWEMYRILSKISSTRCTRWLVGTQFVLDILLRPNSGRRGSSPNGAGWNGCLRCWSVCLEGRSLVHHRFDVYGNCGIEEIDRTFKVNRQAIRNKTQTNTNTNTKKTTTTTTNLVRGPWLSPSHSEGWKLSPSYDGRVSDLCVVSQRRKCERVVDLWWTSCESSGSWTNENWCRKVLISLTTGLL